MSVERQESEYPLGTPLEMSFREIKDLLSGCVEKIYDPCIRVEDMHIRHLIDQSMVVVVSDGEPAFGIWTFRENPDSALGYVGVIPEIDRIMREGSVG